MPVSVHYLELQDQAFLPRTLTGIIFLDSSCQNPNASSYRHFPFVSRRIVVRDDFAIPETSTQLANLPVYNTTSYVVVYFLCIFSSNIFRIEASSLQA